LVVINSFYFVDHQLAKLIQCDAFFENWPHLMDVS
jgi:hypothetical protein